MGTQQAVTFLGREEFPRKMERQKRGGLVVGCRTSHGVTTEASMAGGERGSWRLEGKAEEEAGHPWMGYPPPAASSPTKFTKSAEGE